MSNANNVPHSYFMGDQSPPPLRKTRRLLTLERGQSIRGLIGLDLIARRLAVVHFARRGAPSELCPGNIDRCKYCSRGQWGTAHLYCAFRTNVNGQWVDKIIHLGTDVPQEWDDQICDLSGLVDVKKNEKTGRISVRPVSPHERNIVNNFLGGDITEGLMSIFAGRIAYEGTEMAKGAPHDN